MLKKPKRIEEYLLGEKIKILGKNIFGTVNLVEIIIMLSDQFIIGARLKRMLLELFNYYCFNVYIFSDIKIVRYKNFKYQKFIFNIISMKL